MGFVGSYLWSLRQRVGHELVLMPGAVVVLADGDGRVLFQRRTDNGAWDLPSGGAEPGSTFRSTAATEVAEETGLVVDPDDLTPFGCLSDPEAHTVDYPNGDRTHYFSMCFVARGWTGELAPEASEVQELAWLDPMAPPEPLQPSGRAVLGLYREFQATGRFQVR